MSKVIFPVMQWNPSASHSRMRISPDGFTVTSDSPRYFSSAIGTYPMQPGSIYYFEVVLGTEESRTMESKIGVTQEQHLDNETGFSGTAKGWAYYSANGGQKRHCANSGTFPYAVELSKTTQVGVLVDMVDCRLGFVVAGLWHGFAFRAPEFVCSEPLFAGFSLLNSGSYCEFLKRNAVWDFKKICVYAGRRVAPFKRLPSHLMKEIAEYLPSYSVVLPDSLILALSEEVIMHFEETPS